MPSVPFYIDGDSSVGVDFLVRDSAVELGAVGIGSAPFHFHAFAEVHGLADFEGACAADAYASAATHFIPAAYGLAVEASALTVM